ncbi:hypothetical protein D3C76_1221300 [compost metagenome]
MTRLERCVFEINLEDLAKGMAVRHPVEAERTDQQVYVQRLQALTEDPLGSPAAQDLVQRIEHGLVHRANDRRALHILAVMHVLVADDTHEIDVAIMVIEGELHQPANALTRLQFSQVQAALGVADITVELLQHLDVQLLLAVEVVVDHALGGLRALGDRIDPGASQPLLDELADRRLENVLAGLFRVVLAALARRGFRGCAECWGSRHTGLMAIG